MHFADETIVQLRVSNHGLFASTKHDEQFFPMFEWIVMLANQKANKGELQLGQNFINPEKGFKISLEQNGNIEIVFREWQNQSLIRFALVTVRFYYSASRGRKT